MKRFIVTLFALLYLMSASGVAINRLYCCGKLKKTSVFLEKDVFKNCKCDKKSGCCDTKTVLVKVQDNHSPAKEIKLTVKDFSNQFFYLHQMSPLVF